MGKLHVTKGLLGVLGLLSILLAVLGLVFWRAQNQSNTSRPQVVTLNNLCNSDDIGTEIKSHFPGVLTVHAPDMGDIIERINQLPEHGHSVNCLFVLGNYYTHLFDFGKATKFYNELLKLHGSTGEWVDPLIGTVTPDQIRDTYKFLKDNGEPRRATNESSLSGEE